MSFVITLMGTLLVSLRASRSIAMYSSRWYAGACAADLLYVYGLIGNLPVPCVKILSILIQRGLLGTSLIIIVMLCGLLTSQSRLWPLMTIRTELSLLGCILVLPHCINYLHAYLPSLTSTHQFSSLHQALSLLCALVLFVLLLLLGSTSLRAIKQRIVPTTWKKIQRSSYIFFGLIAIHQILILYPSILKHKIDPAIECFAMLAIVGAYSVIKLSRLLMVRRL